MQDLEDACLAQGVVTVATALLGYKDTAVTGRPGTADLLTRLGASCIIPPRRAV